LHFIYNHPNISEIRGNPQKLLDAIDEYGKTKKYLMNVGEYKSRTVAELIKEVKPRVMVELGGYVGYSAVAFGAAFREAGGEQYYSLEYNPEFGAIISSLVDLAGLHDFVRVEIGQASASLRRLHEEGRLNKIDLMFLDHVKPMYTPDLKLCEELGLVRVGSVLAADNGESL
jgi:catechol O-methyltransferase